MSFSATYFCIFVTNVSSLNDVQKIESDRREETSECV